MTDPTTARLTDTDLDEIAARAGHLFEYVTMPSEADQLAGVDVPALLDEVRRLRVVPSAPAGQGAVLNAAAQHLYTALFPAVYDDMGQKAAEGVNRAVSELRRMADEAQQPEAREAEVPAPGFYRHYKGGTYEVVAVGRHTETGEPLVVYRSDTAWWCRPLGSFVSDVVAGGETVARFTPVEAQATGEDIAAADNPTRLRWGLDDVLWGDDDSVTVLLSGPEREPYWLELDPERAAVLRRNLAGPDAEAKARPSVEIECANCWRLVENRGTPSMDGNHSVHWVHVPGGFTACFPQLGADSPRAEPKPAVVESGKEA